MFTDTHAYFFIKKFVTSSCESNIPTILKLGDGYKRMAKINILLTVELGFKRLLRCMLGITITIKTGSSLVTRLAPVLIVVVVS